VKAAKTKKIKLYKAEKSLPYLVGNTAEQAYKISLMLVQGSDYLDLKKTKSGVKQINEAYIHLSRLVHSM
jgi:hypothetical protein